VELIRLACFALKEGTACLDVQAAPAARYVNRANQAAFLMKIRQNVNHVRLECSRMNQSLAPDVKFVMKVGLQTMQDQKHAPSVPMATPVVRTEFYACPVPLQLI
jgi:hypothetical protein